MKEANNIETNFDGIDFYDESGNVIDDMNSYMENLKNVVTYEGTIEIGSIVKRKKRDQLVVVEQTDIDTCIGKFDFAGKKIDDSDEDLVLFNRKDVEAVLLDKNMDQSDHKSR